MNEPPFTVREAVHRLLREYGMTTIFGNPGSTEMGFFDDWPTDLRYVLALQEASAVAMADGYAQATGNATFVNLHSAAGLGNALGSLFSAYRNQTPLVVMAGQQSREMSQSEPFLYADQAASFPQPYVKWSSEPALASQIPAALARGYHLAMQPPRGPVFLSIPSDDWQARAQPSEGRKVYGAAGANAQGLEELASALLASNNPVLVVGPAVDAQGAWELAVVLAELTRAAVWASPRAHRASFPEDHPSFQGFLPFERQGLRLALERHDLIIVVGAPVFTYHVHSQGPHLANGSRLYQLTDDPDQAARAAAGTAVVGAISPSLQLLVELLQEHANEHVQIRQEPPLRHREHKPRPATPLTSQYVLHTLASTLPRNSVVVEEAPSHRRHIQAHLPITRPRSFYTTASGGLGWAMPAAVGIKLAEPERPVVCLIGDGSSMYSPQALWTAARHKLPILVVIMNNGSYGAMKGIADMLAITNAPSFELPGLDPAIVARGFGCDTLRVETPHDLTMGLGRAFAGDSPLVLDVRLAPAEAEFA